MADLKVNYTADTTGIDKANKKVSKDFSSLTSAVGGLAMPVAAFGAALGALSIGGLVKGFGDLFDYAGSLTDLSDRTGFAAGKLAIYQKALKDTGVDAEGLTKIISGISNKIEEPDSNTLEWLEKFNLKIADLQAMSPEGRFETISKAIGGLASQSQKMKASSDLFGKLGPSLVAFFKSPDAIGEASKYIGSLAGNMTNLAGDLDSVGDSIGSVNLKFMQFFAGMAGPNMNLFKDLKTTIDNIDLGPLGEKFGNVFNGVLQTFKNDPFAGITLGLQSALEQFNIKFGAIMGYAGQTFANTVIDTLATSKLGKTLGIEKHDAKDVSFKQRMDYNSQQKIYDTPIVEKLSKIFPLFLRGVPALATSYWGDNDPKIRKSMKTGDLSWQEWNAKIKKEQGGTPATDDLIATSKNSNASTKDSKVAVNPGLSAAEKSKLKMDDDIKAFTDAVNKASDDRSAYDKEFPNLKEREKAFTMDAYKPQLSHIASIGGAKGITSNPLVSLHQQTNKLLQGILRNTSSHSIAILA